MCIIVRAKTVYNILLFIILSFLQLNFAVNTNLQL